MLPAKVVGVDDFVVLFPPSTATPTMNATAIATQSSTGTSLERFAFGADGPTAIAAEGGAPGADAA